MTLRHSLLKSWHKENLLSFVLLPLSVLYYVGFWCKRFIQQTILKPYQAPVPVIVVGNLTVGGTGKTPLVIALVEALRKHGFKPAVISRGYHGSSKKTPLLVTQSTDVTECGDEPALIVRRLDVPLVVSADRRAAIETVLSAAPQIDVIISDDGLQHFALQRDIEICLVDKTQSQENGFLLPAGPYREPRSRLNSVDYIVEHYNRYNNVSQNKHNKYSEKTFTMYLQAGEPQALKQGSQTWSAQDKIHAVAGIGNPQRFFQSCRDLGYEINEHIFADHHAFIAADIDFADQAPVLMTEKDAVKCAAFADHRHWYLPVDARLDDDFFKRLLEQLRAIAKTQQNDIKNT